MPDLLPEIAAIFDDAPPPPKAFAAPEVAALAVASGYYADPGSLGKAALAARLPWEDVASGYRAAFGQDAPDELAKGYNQDLKLEQARDKYRGAQETGVGFALRRAVPFGSAIGGLRRENRYAEAVNRLKSGKAEEDDYEVIAQHERLQEIDKERSTGEAVGAALAHVPAILGEGAVAGKALGAGARLLGMGAKAGAVGTGEAVAQASRLKKAGQFAARVPPMTALMPSMYLEEAGRRAAEKGGKWTDASNFAPAYGMGMATVAVLGSLQKFVNTGSVPTQIVGKTALGMGEQAVVDTSAQLFSDRFLSKAYQLDTGYGLAGDILKAAKGEKNDALKHALTQASVFGVFSAIHVAKHRGSAEAKALEVPSALAEAMRKIKEDGYPEHMAEELARSAGETLAEVNEGVKNGTVTSETIRDRIKADPENPLNPVLEKVADGLPDAEQLRRIIDRSTLDDALKLTEQRDAEARGRAAPTKPDFSRGLRMRPGEIEPGSRSQMRPQVAEPAPKTKNLADKIRQLESELQDAEFAFDDAHDEYRQAANNRVLSTGHRDHWEYQAAEDIAGEKVRDATRKMRELKAKLEATRKGLPDESVTTPKPDGIEPPRSQKRPTPDPEGIEPVPDAPVPPDYVAVLGEDAVRAVAKRFGFTGKGKIETVLDRIASSPSARIALESRTKSKLDETAQPPAEKVPETTPGPETAPEAPPAADPAKPVESPTEGAERPAEATPGRQAISLGEGRQTGEKTPQGETLTVHDVTDSTGKVIGDVKVLPSGGTLKVHWVSLRGAAATDKAAKGALGNAAVAGMYRELAAKYPDAVMVKYVPAEGRLQAGTDIVLERVKDRSGRDTFRRYKGDRSTPPAPGGRISMTGGTGTGRVSQVGGTGKGRIRTPGEARDAFNRANEESKAEPHPLDSVLPGEGDVREVEVGDRTVAVVFDAKRNSVDIQFGETGARSDTTGVSKGLREGTVPLLREVARIARSAADKGISVEYEAEPRRHALYSRVLKEAGLVEDAAYNADLGPTSHRWVKAAPEPQVANATPKTAEKTAEWLRVYQDALEYGDTPLMARRAADEFTAGAEKQAPPDEAGDLRKTLQKMFTPDRDIRTAVADGLRDSPNLTPEQRAEYGRQMNAVLDAMPEAARKELSWNADEFVFVESTAVLPARVRARMEAEADTPEKEAILRDLEAKIAEGMSAAGFVWGGRVYVNGGRKKPAGGRHGGTYEADAVYAHEIGHVLDGREGNISSHEKWHDAFLSEIDTVGESPLSDYARQSPSEAFAEFARLLYASKVGTKQIEAEFPKASAFFKERGWFPEPRGGQRTSAPEVFTARVGEPDSPDHVDMTGGKPQVANATPLDRLRQAEARRGKVQTPEPFRPKETAPEPAKPDELATVLKAAEELGAAGKLPEVAPEVRAAMDAADLSPELRYVLDGLAAGKDLKVIADEGFEDGVLRKKKGRKGYGKPYTKESIRLFGEEAIGKLPEEHQPGFVERLRATEAAERVGKYLDGKVERGELSVKPEDAPVVMRRLSATEQAEAEFERLTNEWVELKEREDSGEIVTDADRQSVARRLEDADRRSKGRQPAAEEAGAGVPGRTPQARPERAPQEVAEPAPVKPTLWQEQQRQKRLAREREAEAAKRAKQAEAEERRLKKAADQRGGEETIRAWVRSEGGLDPKEIAHQFGNDWQRNEPWLIHLVTKKGKRTIGADVLAENAQEAGILPVDPTRNPSEVLFDHLQKNTKLGRAAEAESELALREYERRQAAEAEERGEKADYVPSDEEIPYSRGNAAPPGTGPGSQMRPEAPITPAQMIADQNRIFGRATTAKDYRGEKRIPGGGEARADLRAGTTTTTKEADLLPFTNLEENAHHLSYRGKFETDPNKLPAGVADGFQDLNRAFGRSYPMGRTAMVEGYASWVKLRASKGLKDLSENAQKAADYAEAWSKEKGYTEKLDAVGKLYDNYLAQSAEQRAAGLGSATGQVPEAARTSQEVVNDLAERFTDDIDNDIASLVRMEERIDKTRKEKGLPPLKDEQKASVLLAGVRHSGKAFAGTMERDGVPVMTADGKWLPTGPSLERIVEGAKPEWTAPGEGGAASRAGTYAVARHVVSERARGYAERDAALAEMQVANATRERATGEDRKTAQLEYERLQRVYKEKLASTEARINLVPEEQFKEYEAALKEARADREFVAWAEPFADRLTAAFDATQKLFESVGLTTKGTAERLSAKYPDYVPTERVRSDAGWNQLESGKKGEQAARVVNARSGSGEAIVDPLLSYKRRLLVAADAVNQQLVRRRLYDLAHQEDAGPFLAVYDRGVARTAKGQAQAQVLKDIGVSPENITGILKNLGLERAESYFRAEPWPQDGSKPTIEILVDGEPVTLRVGDRSLYELATNQQTDAHQTARILNGIANFEVFGVKPVQVQKDVIRTGATGVNLAFQARNVPRDIWSYWKNTIERTKGLGPLEAAARLVPEYWNAYGRMLHTFAENFREYRGGKAARKGAGRKRDPLWDQFIDARGDQLRQLAFERDNPEKAYNGIASTPTKWSLAKDFLNFLGAGELAPRFREFRKRLEQVTGKSEDVLRKEFAEADKALQDGKPVPDPVPFNQLMAAMNAAAEVTVPFGRQGVVTRQMNAITPFFGPAVAGVSKALRQAKADPKRALMALGLLGAARTLHWLMYHDEDWYKELSAHDKFNNFVVDTPVGLRRLPGPRDIDLAVGGTLVTMLDAAADSNPHFASLLEQSLEANLPPGIGPIAGELSKGEVGMAGARALALPAGPVGSLGVEMLSNRDWTGKPIVPRRDESKTSDWEQFRDHYGPYALKQLTGGRGEASKTGLGLDFFPEVRNLRRSIDELHDRYHELEVQKARAERSGRRFEGEAEFKRLGKARQEIGELAAKARGERKVGTKTVRGEKPDDEVRKDLMEREAAIARRAMGR